MPLLNDLRRNVRQLSQTELLTPLASDYAIMDTF